MARGIPRAESIQAYLDDISAAVRDVGDAWRWLLPDAYRRPQHARREAVSGGGRTDVGDTVIVTERVRSHLRSAARGVETARSSLLGALAALHDAMTALDPPLDGPTVDVRYLPHRADGGDVERAREAQARRRERAMRTGDWSEVTG